MPTMPIRSAHFLRVDDMTDEEIIVEYLKKILPDLAIRDASFPFLTRIRITHKSYSFLFLLQNARLCRCRFEVSLANTDNLIRSSIIEHIGMCLDTWCGECAFYSIT